MLHKHRILPGHMGGIYEPSNVELLTVPQHAEAHRLLYENFGQTADLVAWQVLSGQIGKDEALLTILQSPEHATNIHASWTPERRAQQSVIMRGNKHSLGKNLGNTNMLGYVHTVEAKAKISAALKGNVFGRAGKNKSKSAEHRAKISAALKGKAKSKEHIEKSVIAKRLKHTAKSTYLKVHTQNG